MIEPPLGLCGTADQLNDAPPDTKAARKLFAILGGTAMRTTRSIALLHAGRSDRDLAGEALSSRRNAFRMVSKAQIMIRFADGLRDAAGMFDAVARRIVLAVRARADVREIVAEAEAAERHRKG